ncbi:MAG: mechanosensitive ion channel family protein [Desulfobacterales bacterium]|jgi:small-conductance mechanosensitive channel
MLLLDQLDQTVYHNTIREWIYAGLAVIFIFLVVWISKTILSRQINKISAKTATQWDDLVAGLFDKIKFLFLVVISFYAGARLLTLPDSITNFINKFVGIVLLVQVGILASEAIRFWLTTYRKQKIENHADAVTTVTSVGFIVKILVWLILLLIALDNLGLDVTALIAGLGVGGIAVALAVQSILGDLFASFTIVLDKPFVIGDFIIVDNFMGTIEHIGLKTTRVRSLSGEQLIFSNSDLLKTRIRNFKRMYERRVVFSLGVVYQTSRQNLTKIPKIIKNIIEKQEQTRFDRAHFKEYGSYALNFEIVYWIENPDYNIYMDIQQAINLEIFQQFEKEGIEFAYPSQSIFINDDSSVKAALNP